MTHSIQTVEMAGLRLSSDVRVSQLCYFLSILIKIFKNYWKLELFFFILNSALFICRFVLYIYIYICLKINNKRNRKLMITKNFNDNKIYRTLLILLKKKCDLISHYYLR